jgi:hypothetical protein
MSIEREDQNKAEALAAASIYKTTFLGMLCKLS